MANSGLPVVESAFYRLSRPRPASRLNYLRNRGLDLSRPACVALLDEIQYAPNVPSIVKYLYDASQTAGQPGIKFILTGSSSFYLKHFFTESLAGRKVVFEMFPLSFGEFLAFRGVPYRPRTDFAETAPARDESRLAPGAPGGPLPDAGIHRFYLGRVDLLAHTASIRSCVLASRLMRAQRGGCRPHATPQPQG